MNTNNFEVLPLFSSPIAKLFIDDDISKLQKIKTDYQFSPTCTDFPSSEGTYEVLNILEDFPEEKFIIEKYFCFYKDNVLKYQNIDFKMTTSWATRTTKNTFSEFHCHRNCMFSGILYLDNDKDAAPIEFESRNNQEQIFILPTEYTPLNAIRWSYKPQKNMMLIFPSYLYHRIGVHNSLQPRYSIAFNFFPEGKLGVYDSTLNISIPSC